MKEQLISQQGNEERRRQRETKRESVSPNSHTTINENNFFEKIFLLKSSVGKKERRQFALSALGLGGTGGRKLLWGRKGIWDVR